MLQDNLRYSDSDIIAIFEDDADIAIPDIHQALINEFKEMTTDLLFLGGLLLTCLSLTITPALISLIDRSLS